jgi:hypothetical protein
MKIVTLCIAGIALWMSVAFISPHVLTGRWIAREKDGSSTYVDFKADHTFQVYHNGKLMHHGNYRFSDPVFSITDDEGCGIGYWAKYDLTFFGTDSVSFKVAEDSCVPRRQEINGSGLIRPKRK